jgi:hypothetical protein
MERLPEIKPYKLTGPVTMKVEYTPRGTPLIHPLPGTIERLNDRTWVIRRKNIVDACTAYFFHCE